MLPDDVSERVITSGNTYQNIRVEGSAHVRLGNEYTIEPIEQKILKWLSPLDPWAKHKEARDEYRQGTLDWFFCDPTFIKWLNGGIQVLWCSGPMGTGKTILMSAILEHLSEHDFAQQDVAVAFLYCQYLARDVQTLGNILGCLLSQLYLQGAANARIPSAVSDAYLKCPSISAMPCKLQEWLLQEIQLRHRTIILLDGLDEITQQLRDELLDAVGISGLRAPQVLVTSRIIPDIKIALGDPEIIQVYAPDSSIDALINSRLKAPSSRRFMTLLESGELEQDMRQNVLNNAQGMLLLASLQLELVTNSRSILEVRKTIDNLPSTLDKYYDLTWERIQSYPDPRDSAYAKIALLWITHSAQPLTLRQMQHAINASLGDKCDVKYGLISQHDILALCAGTLASSAATLGNVGFSHFSALEYFSSRRLRYFPDAHDLISRACVRYLKMWLGGLSDSDFGDIAIVSDDTPLSDMIPRTLHRKQSQESAVSVVSSTSSIIGPRARDNLPERRKRSLAEREQRDSGAIRIGLRQTFKIDSSGLGFGKRFVLLTYAHENLWYHARYANVAQEHVLRLIHRYPVLYNIKDSGDWKQCPYQDWLDRESDFWYTAQAMHHGLTNHSRFIQCSSFNGTPLWRTEPKYNATQFLQFLIASQADRYKARRQSRPSGMSWRLRAYLLFASQLYHDSEHGVLDIVRNSIMHVDKICQQEGDFSGDLSWTWLEESAHQLETSLTPLIEATQRGQLEIVERLINAKADIEHASASCARPLWYAYISGNFECLKLLVENGAELTALKDDPVFALSDIKIEITGTRIVCFRTLEFLAYGPDKSWFNKIKYIVSTPECNDGVWQARVKIGLSGMDDSGAEDCREPENEIESDDKGIEDNKKDVDCKSEGEPKKVWRHEGSRRFKQVVDRIRRLRP